MEAFEKELTHLLNKHSIENVADMPDFLLAGMICRMIDAMGPSIKKTLNWQNATLSGAEPKLVGKSVEHGFDNSVRGE